MHDAEALTGITLVAVVATLCGVAMVRVRQPAIIGYILCGVILGPSALSLVENREAINLLARLGVILLLYFIGMELSLRSFRQIWKTALITTMLQIAVSVGALYAATTLFGWPTPYAILFGFCLALSSTAVAVTVLEDVGELRSQVGKVAIGILIAQDLAVAPMLVTVGNLAGGGIGIAAFVEVAVSVGILIGLIIFLTRRTRVNLPFHYLIADRPSLTPLAGLAWCFAFASLGGAIGLSPAFGAFLAGLIVGNSAQRQTIHEHAGPIQAVLLMVFFLSIGLLVDLQYVWENLWLLVGVWAFVTIFKTALNVIVLRLQGETWNNALSVALVIGQLGEFTFVLAAVALSAGVIDEGVHKAVVAVTVLSLATSPVFFDFARRLRTLVASGTGSDEPLDLFRFAYVKEWTVTKHASLMVLETAFRAATWAQVRIDRMRNASKNRLEARKARVKTADAKEESAPGSGEPKRKLRRADKPAPKEPDRGDA